MSRNVERAKAGGAGVLLGIVVMWALREYVGFEPPGEVSDAMMGLMVVLYGAVHSRFVGPP